MTSTSDNGDAPAWSPWTAHPKIHDRRETETSVTQSDTVELLLPLLHRDDDGPTLERDKHVTYLHSCLGKLPSAFIGLDASRPWQIYWTLAGLSLLGEDVTRYRSGVIQTLAPMQNADGGFGGGHGQNSHCATSYASILSLAMVGGEEALELVDRKALWKWLGRIKRADGGFEVGVGGEVDVRPAYCALTMISLLGLPLELPSDAPARQSGRQTFGDGLPEYLSRCQTFEGGISGAPQTEAHGANLDVPMLIRWLSARQYAPEGGFSGRTNKLVDGCYSHWVGGCWPLLRAAMNQGSKQAGATLYSTEGLVRYILCCCQNEFGGLRDKPNKFPDAYHTCYTLAGLSSASHGSHISSHGMWSSVSRTEGRHPSHKHPGAPGMREDGTKSTGSAWGRVEPFHPVYVIPYKAVIFCQTWVLKQEGF